VDSAVFVESRNMYSGIVGNYALIEKRILSISCVEDNLLPYQINLTFFTNDMAIGSGEVKIINIS